MGEQLDLIASKVAFPDYYQSQKECVCVTKRLKLALSFFKIFYQHAERTAPWTFDFTLQKMASQC